MTSKLYLFSDPEIRNICIGKIPERIVILENNNDKNDTKSINNDEENKIFFTKEEIDEIKDLFSYNHYVNIETIFEINEIFPKLYITSVYTMYNKKIIDDYQIKNVINLYCSEDNIYSNINYLNMLIMDENSQDITNEQFQTMFDFIDKSLEKNESIVVHCEKGVSRSPTIVIAYLMYKFNYDYLQAYYKVAKIRCIRPNDGFKKILSKRENYFRVIGSPDKYPYKYIYYQTIGHDSGRYFYHTYNGKLLSYFI